MILKDVVVEFEVSQAKLISINEQYIHPVKKTKRGRYVSYFAPSPYLKEVKKFYQEILNSKISDEQVKELQDAIGNDKYENGLCLEIVIGIPDNGWKDNDVSNFIKCLEDRLVERIGIDDSRNFKVSAEKRHINSEDYSVQVTIKTMKSEAFVSLNSGVVSEGDTRPAQEV